ncbi:hypothetical protein E4P42_16340 [Mycobacterium sp. PS03-16]|uniref:hypothetical protein n=1 Tax=Mycobacterium sp. PS03-16 TaxID=2559611 RepID=UPI00107306E6|nr:hypothetical protein [Mycobacterium sp. PS03-16]TFV57196.1 hypothetical protein E4P42_16340 [Mycobacterium sp. PS03-16]
MRRWAAAAGVAAAALLAACGSEAAPQESETSPAGSTGHGSYAQCLQAHDVAAPPGPVSAPPSGVDEQAWREAMASCASLAPGPA